MSTLRVNTMATLCRQRYAEVMIKWCRRCSTKGLMSTLRVESMAVLCRGHDKALTTMNNLAEVLGRHGSYNEAEIVKDVPGDLAIREESLRRSRSSQVERNHQEASVIMWLLC